MFSKLFVSHDADLRAAAAGRALGRTGNTVTMAAHAGHAMLTVTGGRRFDVLIVENELPEGPPYLDAHLASCGPGGYLGSQTG